MRPIPHDFLQMHEAMPQYELVKYYKASSRTIQQWIKKLGVAKYSRGAAWNRRPVPADWVKLAPTMLKSELAEHYKASTIVMDRWIEETGAHPKPYKRKANQNSLSMMGRGSTKLADIRVRSIYDEAADTLRRERFIVSRCDEKGAFSHTGEFWRVGWSVCTGDELLQRAARYRKAA